MKKIFTLLFASMSALSASAQCPGGQVMVTVDVATDTWGYECYWEVTPTGSPCGVGTLASFGNPVIGCAGGGAQVAAATDVPSYASSTTITESLGCIPTGTCVDIHYVDDFGDGGATFTVNVNGIAQTPLVGDLNGNIWNACATAPAVNDVNMLAAGSGYSKTPLSQVTALGNAGSITSAGTGNVTGATMMVTILQGATPVYTATSATQNIASGVTANFTVAGYVPTAAGTYTITYTSDITETDENLANNVTTMMVEVTDSVFARDNNTQAGILGIGAGELGYLGNMFEVENNVMLSSVSALIGNQTGTLTGSTLTMVVFATDAMGTPTTQIATATGTVGATADQWYTLDVSPNEFLAPGKYVVCVQEDIAIQQEVGTAVDVFTPLTSWVSWTTQPWANTETFGPAFAVTFMVRANMNQYASVSELNETSVTVYPNPAQNELNVSGVSVGATINVYNNVGQIVLSTIASDNLMNLNVTNLVSGVYTVKTINGTNVGVAKFVKK